MLDGGEGILSARLLRGAMDVASRVLERRNVIPVLGMLRFSIEDDTATFTGTDLDSELTVRAVVGSANLAPICVSPKFLLRVLHGAGSATVAHDISDHVLTVTADDMTARIRDLIPAEDFPMMVMPDEGRAPVCLPASLLRRMLKATMPSVSKEESRYYLHGVYLHAHEKGLRAAATDGHRMSIFDAEVDWPLTGAILPSKAGRILIGLLAGLDSDVTVTQSVNGTKLRFTAGDWCLTTKVIDGTFPDYTRVMPKIEEVKLSAAISLTALRRFPIGFDGRSTALSFRAGKNVMETRSADGNVLSLPCHIRGDSDFGFNLLYLKVLAGIAEDGVIRIEGDKTSNPFRVLNSDPAQMHVIMPMRI